VCLVACLTITQVAPAAIIFTGHFDVANFDFDDGGGLGSVDTSLAPGLVVLHGHDEGEDDYPDDIITSFLVDVLVGGAFEFYWRFETEDEDGPEFDPFGYYLNGDLLQLTDDEGDSVQFGFTSVILAPGDRFGFYTDATDGCCGPSHTAISGDPIGEVPEPATPLLIAAGLSAVGLLRRRR